MVLAGVTLPGRGRGWLVVYFVAADRYRAKNIPLSPYILVDDTKTIPLTPDQSRGSILTTLTSRAIR